MRLDGLLLINLIIQVGLVFKALPYNQDFNL